MQGIILRNVLSPILHTLGGLHFQNRGGLTVLVVQKVVPHTAEDFHIREEITPSLLEVIGTPHIGRSDKIAHKVGFLHVLSLFRLNGLTGEGVDRVLKGLLVGTGDFAPDLKGSRPRVQAENGGEPGCRQLLGLLGRNDLNTVVVEPFHNQPSCVSYAASISFTPAISWSHWSLVILEKPSVFMAID